MNAEQIKKLKELALLASPGPWYTQDHYADNGEFSHVGVESQEGAELIGEEIAPGQADTRYIAAANPAAILELIALAERTSSAGSAVVMSDERIMEIAAPHLKIDISDVSEQWLMDCRVKFIACVRAILSAAAAQPVQEPPSQQPVAQHPDDIAVDRFAAAMKAKMAKSRAKGRGGWDDEAQCSMDTLARLLIEHVAKGDPVDIGNLAMMLHQREVAAMEHHPCYGGEAAKALKLYAAAQAPILPSTPEQVIAFINSNFDSRDERGDKADWRFQLSVHDLLSAFSEWNDQAPAQAPDSRDAARFTEVAERAFNTDSGAGVEVVCVMFPRPEGSFRSTTEEFIAAVDISVAETAAMSQSSPNAAEADKEA